MGQIMMTRDHIYPEGEDWNWLEDTPFAHSVGVGDQVFIAGQQTLYWRRILDCF